MLLEVKKMPDSLQMETVFNLENIKLAGTSVVKTHQAIFVFRSLRVHCARIT
jgi:hypothetical protein